jgi:tRNA pseudouridine55 synthase
MEFSKESLLAGEVILIDKPLNWTSFQVVNKIRWLIRKNFDIKKIKVGHAGTLDPLATGLLIICCGKMTKEIDRFQAQEKTYSGTFRIGATTPSYDLETEIDQVYPTDHISLDFLEKSRLNFLGHIEQQPPIFSALKKEGKRLYEYARKGEEIEVPMRRVNIHQFDINTSSFPDIQFEINCSKGTYIRSLAHDFGKDLESGAHLTSLRREKIGEYHVNKAFSIETFESLVMRNQQ